MNRKTILHFICSTCSFLFAFSEATVNSWCLSMIKDFCILVIEHVYSTDI